MKKYLLAILFSAFFINSNAQTSNYIDFGQQAQWGDVAVFDFNNDGKLDVIFNGVQVSDKDYPRSGLMINNGDGSFTNTLSTYLPRPITGRFATFKFGDINHDGFIDVIYNGKSAYNTESQHLGIFLNNSTGNLEYAFDYDIINAHSTCGFADLNNDGLTDYFFAGDGLGNGAFYFQQQDGSFVKNAEFFANYDFTDPEISTVDINNDGFLDLFVMAFKNAPLVEGEVATRFCATYMNDGNGQFTLFEQPNLIAKSYGSATWGDINGDGWLDLLLNGDGASATGEASNDIFRIYSNNDGTLIPEIEFKNYRQISTGGGGVFVDWDNDGDLDIILGGWSGTKNRQATALFLCTDAENFTYEESPLTDTFFPGVSESNYEVADLNNDGRPDLLIMGFNGRQDNQVGKFNKRICGYSLNPSTEEVVTKQAAPTDLQAIEQTIDGKSAIKFSWSGPTQPGLTYNLAVRNTETDKWYYNPLAVIGGENDGWRKVTGAGNVWSNKSWTLFNLPNGTYEWTVQAIDGAYNGGAFAPNMTLNIQNSSISSTANHLESIVYANNGMLRVKTSAAKSQLTIYGINGMKIFSDVIGQNFEMPLNKGLYLVELKDENNIQTNKVSVN